jgi:hypothetical protein
MLPYLCSLPKWQEGRHPHCHYRAAQGSHALRPAGSLSRPRRPLSRGSDPASYPTELLASLRTYRQLSGWNPPPLMIRAFGAHCHSSTHAVQQLLRHTVGAVGVILGALVFLWGRGSRVPRQLQPIAPKPYTQMRGETSLQSPGHWNSGVGELLFIHRRHPVSGVAG